MIYADLFKFSIFYINFRKLKVCSKILNGLEMLGRFSHLVHLIALGCMHPGPAVQCCDMVNTEQPLVGLNSHFNQSALENDCNIPFLNLCAAPFKIHESKNYLSVSQEVFGLKT